MAANVSRRIGREAQRDLIAQDHPSVDRSQSDAKVRSIRTGARRSSTVGGRPILDVGRDRGHDLDAARGIAFGVALGTICWISLGAVLYLIVR